MRPYPQEMSQKCELPKTQLLLVKKTMVKIGGFIVNVFRRFLSLLTGAFSHFFLFLLIIGTFSLGACSGQGGLGDEVLGELGNESFGTLVENPAAPIISDTGADVEGPVEDEPAGGKWGSFDEAAPLPEDPNPNPDPDPSDPLDSDFHLVAETRVEREEEAPQEEDFRDCDEEEEAYYHDHEREEKEEELEEAW